MPVVMSLLLLVGILMVAAKQSPVYDLVASCNEGQIMKFQSSAWSCQNDATGSGLATGDIVLRNGACNAGFTELAAVQGRAIVGTPSGGTDGGTVGTALTNQQDKTHSHTYTDVVNHAHVLNSFPTATGGSTGFTRDTSMSGTVADTSLSTNNPTGGVATGTTATKATSDVISYIQLRACSKD